METEKMIPANLAVALMSQRKELLVPLMRGYRREAEKGRLTGLKLDLILNALEVVCEEVIDARLAARGFSDEDEDECEEGV